MTLFRRSNNEIYYNDALRTAVDPKLPLCAAVIKNSYMPTASAENFKAESALSSLLFLTNQPKKIWPPLDIFSFFY